MPETDIELEAAHIAMRSTVIAEAQDAIEAQAQYAAWVRESYLRHGFTREEAFELVREELGDARLMRQVDEEYEEDEDAA